MKTEIAIIGAGMNGLALALSLRLFGFKATLYEQAVQPRVEGTGIAIWPEGMQILAALASKKEIKSLGDSSENILTCAANGTIINTTALGDISPCHITPTGMFHRQKIFQLLLEKTGLENIKFNKKCLGFTEEKRHVNVNFSDGSNIKADLVIGTDGIYSTVRQQLFPETKLVNSGVSCCRGIVACQNTLLEENNLYVFSGDKSRIVTYSIDAEKQLKYWFAACVLAKNKTLTNKDDILNCFSTYNEKLLAMIVATGEVEILSSYLYELPPMSTWSKGRVTLVGDACCAALPTMAIGFSLGLENSFILAQCLASNYYTPEKAFSRYEHRCLIRSNALLEVTRRLNEIVYKEGVNQHNITSAYQDFFKYISQSPF